MKLDIQKEEDRLTVAAILVKNGYTVKQGKARERKYVHAFFGGGEMIAENMSILDLLDPEEAEALKPIKSDDWKWSFKDYPKEKNGLKVFSCFACGGGQLWDINSQAVK